MTKYKLGTHPGMELIRSHPMTRYLRRWAAREKIRPRAFTNLTRMLLVYEAAHTPAPRNRKRITKP